jgi:hypothetical protein
MIMHVSPLLGVSKNNEHCYSCSAYRCSALVAATLGATDRDTVENDPWLISTRQSTCVRRANA